MFPTYRIIKTSQGNNAYCVDRTETWTLTNDKVFDSEQERLDYIVQENKRHLAPYILTKYLKDEITIEQACTLPEFAHCHKVFSYNPTKVLKTMLQDDGVKVI